MDLSSLISFVEQNKVGLLLDVEGTKVLEVRHNGNDVDVEIHDIGGLKKLKGELKKWRG
jgi:hypothetical protein